MRLRHQQSSSVVPVDGNRAVPCDPWLLGGTFYGSWTYYQPLDFEPAGYGDVDNARIGSHVGARNQPDVYERPHYTTSRLHT